MLPITDALDVYRFHTMDDDTRRSIEHYLNQNYPEVQWSVKFNLERKIMVHMKFKNPKEETFYRLKWSE